MKISDSFWTGFDVLAERDKEFQGKIEAAREAGPPEAAPRARLRKTDSQALEALLRRNQGSTPHKFAQLALKEGVSLTVGQIKGWYGRNKKKVLGGTHN